MAKKRRLLWHLYSTYLLIIIISLAATTWFASRTLKQFYLEQSAEDLQARVHLFEAQISNYLTPIDEKNVDRLCKTIGPQAKTRLTVVLPSGKVIGDSKNDPAAMDYHLDRPEIIEALKGHVGISTRYSRTLEKDMMYVGVPVKKNSHIIAIMRTSVPLDPIDETLKNIEIKIVLGGLFIALIAAILSLLVSRLVSRPIEEIKKGAESFARGEFEHRLPVFTSEELGSLSETMNQMAVELQKRINGMREQRNELEAVLSSMVEGIIALDNEQNIISINKAAAQMLGTSPYDVQGRSIQEVFRNTDFQGFVSNALSTDESVEKDITLYGDNERILNAHSATLHDAKGKSVGALIVLNEVTTLRRLETIRRDFVANVSHEIKTPITAIKGFVETLRDTAMENREDAMRFLTIIEKHVDRLNAIIEDLLSLSRIEQGVEKEDISLVESRIRDIIAASVQLFEGKASSKNIEIVISCDENLKAKVNPPILEQAVSNLLDNAIKYSDNESTINVEVRQTEAETIISVHDRGCGIEEEHLSRLFERFYRADKARSRKLGGTGLGLAIVKHIAQAHQGYVEVLSTPNKGSSFSLHLPII
ncbi:MAG: PAS domain-containing protein [Deltaproteobacteria bacterium]|nr:PAS domain-containing protein [Deltaproteobacteria bacterium]